jgi:hypothetical protein
MGSRRAAPQLQVPLVAGPRKSNLIHSAVELPAVFGFLLDPTIDATNWRAEQALRPAVVNRKVSGGNRSSHGAETQQILASVIHTARLRGLDIRTVLVDLLRARQPIVSPLMTMSE